MQIDTPIDSIEDPNAGTEEAAEAKEPRYVDLDATVVVKSGINLPVDEEEVDAITAAKAFLAHPARALSARELAVIADIDEVVASEAIDVLVAANWLFETNELDGILKRFRVVGV